MGRDTLDPSANDLKQVQAIFFGKKGFLYTGFGLFMLGILFSVLPFVLLIDVLPFVFPIILFYILGIIFIGLWCVVAHQILIVTNKGIIGFGKIRNMGSKRGKIDLPMDSITSTATSPCFFGLFGWTLSFSTPSGNLTFPFVKNFNEINDFIKHRLDERQSNSKNQTGVRAEAFENNVSTVSKLDELKKLYDLKQSGVLSEEEYRKEKDELLK